jgi:hypothetical protein
MADRPLTDQERLDLLEHAQVLHASTLRRHGEMLDKHDEQMTLLTSLLERQQQTQQDLTATQARLTETLEAIKDMLGRGNGH